MTLDLAHVKRISPGWWGAIAGVAAAGAALVPSARILAGLLGGGAMFALALHQTPCCDGCAQGAGCGGPQTVDPGRVTQPTDTAASSPFEAAGNTPAIAEGEGPGALLARAAASKRACA
jgi:hypothetical protein